LLHDGRERDVSARLIVGADGRLSGVRRWFGSESISDPESNRFGGVLVSGVRSNDRDADNVGDSGEIGVNWFAQSIDMTRLYLMGRSDVLRAQGVDRSFDDLIRVAAVAMPDGALDDVHAEGPIGFFPNSNVWASRIAGDGIALIGDAAGAADPTQGHGTSLLFRDVRELSALLLAEHDWDTACVEFEARRRRYYDVILGYDRWMAEYSYGQGDAAERAREGHRRAKQEDPDLGGFAFIEGLGPDGLVADEAARRIWFGEHLA
jgi:2-polyprenyl-6-methoxyphenol hydroxylase-like FAD-dependent oxidoreductase